MKDVTASIATSMDGEFKRTSIVLGETGNGDSVDVVFRGQILARINLFHDDLADWLAVDVIDVKDHFYKRRALTFLNGQRSSLDAGKVVGADFRR